MPSHSVTNYPIDVQQRTHLSLTAYNYRSPTIPNRRSTALNTSATPPVRAERGDIKYQINTYIPSGFGDKMQAKWEKGDVHFAGGTVAELFNSTVALDGGRTVNAAGELATALVQKKLLDSTLKLLDWTGYRDTIEAGLQRTISRDQV
ncbi:MAG: hypothetical protein IIB44_11400 [Candidatus Marinimicrobia bacterium]|nr:hypothetical protein [Candidatus Neomarinimicrobiota bacterium]